jgi:hypothetical protein
VASVRYVYGVEYLFVYASDFESLKSFNVEGNGTDSTFFFKHEETIARLTMETNEFNFSPKVHTLRTGDPAPWILIPIMDLRVKFGNFECERPNTEVLKAHTRKAKLFNPFEVSNKGHLQYTRALHFQRNVVTQVGVGLNINLKGNFTMSGVVGVPLTAENGYTEDWIDQS